MLKAFAEALMIARASLQCGAAHGERSEERTNSRNANRLRPRDTRAGTIEDLAVPKPRTHSGPGRRGSLPVRLPATAGQPGRPGCTRPSWREPRTSTSESFQPLPGSIRPGQAGHLSKLRVLPGIRFCLPYQAS